MMESPMEKSMTNSGIAAAAMGGVSSYAVFGSAAAADATGHVIATAAGVVICDLGAYYTVSSFFN